MLAASPNPKANCTARLLVLFLLFLASAAAFDGYYQKWHFREPMASGYAFPAGFKEMVDGTAPRPYVYRQLVPTVANWIDARLPADFKARALTANGYHMNFFFNQVVQSPLAQDPVYGIRYRIVYLLTFSFTFAAAIALYLASRVAGFAQMVALLSAVTFILFMPWLETVGGFFYDFPELAFFALIYWFVRRFHWAWMIPVVLLASWNKESFLLAIPMLYPLLRLKHSLRTTLLALSSCAAASLAVNLSVRQHFSHNPGGALEWHLPEYFSFTHHFFRSLFELDITFGVVTFAASSVVVLAFVLWLASRGWSLLDRASRNYLLIGLAINLPLYFLFCRPGEMRNLSMTFVGFTLLLAANFVRLSSGFGSGFAAGPTADSVSQSTLRS